MSQQPELSKPLIMRAVNTGNPNGIFTYLVLLFQVLDLFEYILWSATRENLDPLIAVFAQKLGSCSSPLTWEIDRD
jgi:hypothetical protein